MIPTLISEAHSLGWRVFLITEQNDLWKVDLRTDDLTIEVVIAHGYSITSAFESAIAKIKSGQFEKYIPPPTQKSPDINSILFPKKSEFGEELKRRLFKS